ncbi:hypothetical protein MNB_SUP05-SYMBIONT-4-1314 [hydrothermal vent metagenome]|uniref:Uncharacterized protein n=1 Tax=hydrothermal vent metagenome TaxID=652676 RepID=A0A1W1E096_9ZZZZ
MVSCVDAPETILELLNAMVAVMVSIKVIFFMIFLLKYNNVYCIGLGFHGIRHGFDLLGLGL